MLHPREFWVIDKSPSSRFCLNWCSLLLELATDTFPILTLQVFVLVFLRRFNSLVGFPVALTSMVIVSVSGLPGLSVGACLSNALFGLLGVGVGALWFYVLSSITNRVGQG